MTIFDDNTNLDEYQRAAHETAVYPADMALHYLIPALMVEADEYVSAVGDADAAKELGDCLWMVAGICTEMGWTLAEVTRYETDVCVPDGTLVYRAARIADIWVKAVRAGRELTGGEREIIRAHVGKMVRLLAWYAHVHHTTLADVANGNLAKLAARKARGELARTGVGHG